MTFGVDETLTFEQAEDALTKALTDMGRDYRYPVKVVQADEGGGALCVYRWETWQVPDLGILDAPEAEGGPQPGGHACGVGLALHHLGILDTIVPEKDEHNMDTYNYEHNDDGVAGLPLTIDKWALRLLALFQLKQDEGRPWGKAYDFALEQVGREMAETL